MTAFCETPLGDLMPARTRTVDPATHPDDVFMLYSVPSFDRGAPEQTRGHEIGSSKQLLAENDVLLSKIVPRTRRAWVVGPSNGSKLIGSSEWIVFRSDRIVPEYLRRVLVSDGFHARYMQTVAGVGGSLMRARPALVARIRVPLPTMAEQRRIARVLDAADALRAKRRTSLHLTESLISSAYSLMFGNAFAEHEEWPTARLGKLARVIRGASPRPAGDPRYFGGSIPWLKIADISGASGRYVTEIKEGVTEAGMRKSVFIDPGSLILTNSATVGIPKFLAIGSCIHDGFLALLDLDEARLHPVFLYANLLARRRQIVRLAPEGTQKNLNTGIVKALKIPLPPIRDQTRFASHVEAIEDAIDQASRSLAHLDALFASLQSRAFAGEL